MTDARYTNVPVASLQGATMKGRLLKAANNNAWRSRYCALMGQLGLLYIYESEDVLSYFFLFLLCFPFSVSHPPLVPSNN